MFCLNCGKKLPESSKFCMYCGTSVPQLDDVENDSVSEKSNALESSNVTSAEIVDSKEDDSGCESGYECDDGEKAIIKPEESNDDPYNLKRYLRKDGYYYFQLNGATLSYASEVVEFLHLKRVFQPLQDRAMAFVRNEYEKAGDIDGIINLVTDMDFVHEVFEEGINLEINICAANGIYDLNADRVIRESLFTKERNNSVIALWKEEIGDNICEKYDAIHAEAQAEREYREARKEGRSRFVGGGFGFCGAIKGMAQAGAMNMASGAAHSFVNALGNSMTSAAERSRLEQLYKNTETLETIYRAVRFGFSALIYNTATRFDLRDIDIDEYNQGISIVNNLSKGIIAKENALDALTQAIQLNPYVIKVYEEYLKFFMDRKGELQPIAALFDLSAELDAVKNKLIEERFYLFAEDYGDYVKEVIDAVDHKESVFDSCVIYNKYSDFPEQIQLIKGASIDYSYHGYDNVIKALEEACSVFQLHDKKKLSAGFTDSTRIEAIQYINEEIEEINIPEGVETIEKFAFAHCTHLSSVLLPSSVKRIERGAFYDCPMLKTLILPEGLKEFSVTAYTTDGIVTLPSEVSIFGDAEKIRNGVAYFDIPLNSPVYEFFSKQNLLEKTTIITATDIQRKIGNGDCSLPIDFRWSIPSLAERKTSTQKKGLLSPAILEIKPTGEECKNKIDSGVLSHSDIAYLSIGPGIRELGPDSCRNSNVYDAELLDGIEVIGDNAFCGCQYLRQIILPASLNKIGNGAFKSCSDLKVISIPSIKMEFGNEVFAGTDITIECVKDSDVHRYCVSNGIKFWLKGEENPYKMQLEAYVQHQNELGVRHYSVASKKSIYSRSAYIKDLEDSLENISDEAGLPIGFMTLKNIFNKGDTRIYYRLEQPSHNGDFSIDSIATAIWNNQDNPHGISDDGQRSWKIHPWTMAFNQLIGENAYTDSPVIYVNGKEDVEFVGRRAFAGSQIIAFKGIGVKEIWEQAFIGSPNLKLVMLGKEVTRIEDYAFAYCPKLTNIYIPPTVTEIGYYLFYGNNTTVSCIKGSPIHNWCLQNNIPVNVIG